MRTNRALVWQMVLILIGSSAMVVHAAAEEKKPVNVDGKWTWTYKTKDGKDAEAAIKLKQEGDKLTGAYVARDGTQTPIEDGKIKGDELSFDVNREVGGEKMLFKYTGKIDGDTITGKIVFGHPKPTPHEWEAKRAKE
jgi:hypothetical protein